MNADIYHRFCSCAYLDKTHSPWRRRREDGSEYAMFKIVDCKHDDWWYKDFVGVEFLGRFVRTNGVLREIEVVRGFKNVYMNFGRTIHPDDLILI